MRKSDLKKAKHIEDQLLRFSKQVFRLKGISRKAERHAFALQLIDSCRRVEYVKAIRKRDISPARANPHSTLFDPLKASLFFANQGKFDEAFWMVFLYTHFSKNQNTGWLLAREIYGGLKRKIWTWKKVASKPSQFSDWIDRNHVKFTGKFGNHRKYESLKPSSSHGTSSVVRSYVDWTGPSHSHEILIEKATEESDATPSGRFSWLMNDMKQVLRFGRLARFDHLAMVGKLGLADLRPGSPYLSGATGPLAGAKLLVTGDSSYHCPAKVLDPQIIELGKYLNVGMQEMEDSICNWQKSPDTYIKFLG